MSDAFQRARGRWREILTAAGVSAQFLRPKHGPCPICGGKDRFRFDDKHGEGTFFCNQCRAGNGLILLRKFKRCGHNEALEFIESYVGKNAPTKQYEPKPAGPVASQAAERLLAESQSPEVVLDYLRKRGLSAAAPVLRGHPRCAYYVEEDDGRGGKRHRVIGQFPTVVAPIVDREGTLIGVQRVYDAAVPERKKVLGSLQGGAVRLSEATDELAVCEGFETGLAVQELFGLPVWACLSAKNLEAFEPPAGIIRLHVFGDHDESCEGQAAAYNLAVRLNRKARQQKSALEPVKVYLPAETGQDWLDVLVNGGLA